MSDSEYRIADRSELEEDGSRVIATVEGREIAVFRVDGKYHALANFCPHQSGPLCEGPLEGRMEFSEEEGTWEYDSTESVVSCPWHGWKFEIETGENPQTDRYRVPTYDVKEKDDGIYVVLF